MNSFNRYVVLTTLLCTFAACSSQLKLAGQIQEWPSFGRDYTNQRLSPLTQINQSNVKDLKLAWQFKSGVTASFQATPVVTNGVMYVALPYNHVAALDAKTGKELWRYKHERRANWKMCCGPANRGVAVSNGKVFIGTVDARLIALDARNGAKLWDIDVADDTALTENTSSLNKSDSNKQAYGGTGIGIAMAPVVYNGKVIVGVTGVGYGLHIDQPTKDAPLGAVVGVDGRYGRPGFLAAYDMNNGKRIWQFDTIPTQGWEGVFAETTSDGISLNRDIAAEKANVVNNKDAWRYGGGSAWSTPAIDTKTNTLYFGTGNPSPQMNDISRPGDNLYTVSLVALDTETGKLKWHYQQVPHDVWGYDLASPPVLFDYKKDGKTIPAVGQAETEILGAIPYQENTVYLHHDASLLPKRELAWAAVNYHVSTPPADRVAVTYNMNILQNLQSRYSQSKEPLLVTLNHTRLINPAKVYKRLKYMHPIYTVAGAAAQARHAEISGVNRTGFAGAYWRNGFHEDGVVSALEALKHFERACIGLK